MTNTTNTFAIPSWNMGKLEKKITSLNKRAAKIGTPYITLKNLGERKIVAPGYEERAAIMGADWCPKITVYDVCVIGEGPKIDGWKFLGTLDHNTLPGSVIVKTVPGETIPTEFHNVDGSCDHCGKIRRRNETFVLENEDGEHQKVGRQCVRDFIGYDVGQILGQMTRLRNLIDELGDEDEWSGGGGGRWDYSFDHNRILAVTAAVIKHSGWVSRSAAGFDQTATADLVTDVFMPPQFRTDEAKAAYDRWINKLDLNNEKFAKEAIDAREWLKEQTGDNEYMHNLNVIDNSEVDVSIKLFGYWCSLVSVYQRAQERLRVSKLSHKLNEHVGEVKQRMDFDVEIISIKYIEGYYGVVRLHKMLDNEGRTLVWFANTDPNMEIGHKYQIKGTVKSHDEFKDWKQTSLSRVKVLKALESEAA